MQERDLEFFRNATSGPLEGGEAASAEEKATVQVRREGVSALRATICHGASAVASWSAECANHECSSQLQRRLIAAVAALWMMRLGTGWIEA